MATETTGNRQNARLILLTIAGIPLLMILAASWLWYFVVRGDLDLVRVLGTANQGTLVQPPRELPGVTLREDGGEFHHADLERRWTLLVPNRGDTCDAACEQSLYLTRQIHIAMGKEFNRIRRYYVGDRAAADTALAVDQLSDNGPAPANFAAYLADEHRGTQVLQLAPADYAPLFPEQLEDATTWYLVDPAGWIMMSYSGSIPYKDVMADLKFLLKNSSE